MYWFARRVCGLGPFLSFCASCSGPLRGVFQKALLSCALEGGEQSAAWAEALTMAMCSWNCGAPKHLLPGASVLPGGSLCLVYKSEGLDSGPLMPHLPRDQDGQLLSWISLVLRSGVSLVSWN